MRREQYRQRRRFTNNKESGVLHYRNVVGLTAVALCALAALPAFAKEDKVLFNFSSIDQGFHSVAPMLKSAVLCTARPNRVDGWSWATCFN